MSQKKQNLLTKESYEKMLQEVKELEEILIPTTIEQLKDAREEWDLSENYEYHSAKEKLNMLNIRLSELNELIKNSKIVEKNFEEKWSGNVVEYWSKVRVLIDGDKEHDLQIVWAWEVDLDGDIVKISFDSPIWIAIEWKKEWDSVKYKFSDWSKKTVKILSIK